MVECLFFPPPAAISCSLLLALDSDLYRVRAVPRRTAMRKCTCLGAMVRDLCFGVAGGRAFFWNLCSAAYPTSVVYEGLAAVIGLIIWMQLSAVIIFLWCRMERLSWQRAGKGFESPCVKQIIRVDCYFPGTREDETGRPRPEIERRWAREKSWRFEDRWYIRREPATYFRVLPSATSDPLSSLLRHERGPRTSGASPAIEAGRFCGSVFRLGRPP